MDRDAERALSVAKRIRAGTIWINDYHLIDAEAPLGGYKQSGIGRELGSYGLDEYTEVKQINIQLDDAPMGVYQRGKSGQKKNGRKPVPLSDRRPFRDEAKNEAWVEYCENCSTN